MATAALLRHQRQPKPREEASNLAFNLGQLGDLQREVIAGGARIALQIAVIEILAANGRDARLAESMLCDLIEVKKQLNDTVRLSSKPWAEITAGTTLQA